MNKQQKLTALFRETKRADWNQFLVDLPPGMVIELGVAYGGSFKTICKTFSHLHCYGFDWFHGLPEDWKGGCSKGEFSTGGIPPECPRNGSFVVGLVQDTLPVFLKLHQESVSFVHFDMDLYEPTKFALDILTPRFQHGTILLFDEIAEDTEALAHEQRAFREWLDTVDFDIYLMGCFSPYAWAFRLVRP